jgi:hypothetical protein
VALFYFDRTPVLSFFCSPLLPGPPSPELEVGLVDDFCHGAGPPVTAYPSKLSSGEPGSLVPYPGLEPGVEVGKLALETSLSVVRHTAAL